MIFGRRRGVGCVWGVGWVTQKIREEETTKKNKEKNIVRKSAPTTHIQDTVHVPQYASRLFSSVRCSCLRNGTRRGPPREEMDDVCAAG